MSLKLRKGVDGATAQKYFALAVNALREALVSTNIHYDITRLAVSDEGEPTLPSALAVTGTATATIAASLVTVANELKNKSNIHWVDPYAHGTASAAVTTADATNEATAIVLVNALAAAHAAHRTETSVHANNDTVNVVTAATATNAATLATLENDLKTQVNAHIASGLAGAHVEMIDP